MNVDQYLIDGTVGLEALVLLKFLGKAEAYGWTPKEVSRARPPPVTPPYGVRLGCHVQIGLSNTPFYHVLVYQLGIKEYSSLRFRL